MATTIVNLIAQFKVAQEPHTKKVIRLALHTVNAKPTEPPAAAAQMLDVDIPITIKAAPRPRRSAGIHVAVDENNRVVARIANGLVNPLAKGASRATALKAGAKCSALHRRHGQAGAGQPAEGAHPPGHRPGWSQIRLLTSLAWEMNTG